MKSKRAIKEKMVMVRMSAKQFQQLRQHSIATETAAPEVIRQLLTNYLT